MNKHFPELRFPGFEENWVEKSLDKLVTIGSGKDYKHLGAGVIPVYGTGGFMASVDDYLYDGDSVCIGRKGSIDKPMLLKGKFWTVDTLFYTHNFKNILPIFLFYIFNKVNWYKYNEASGVPSLSKSTIYSIKNYIPQLNEQNKIASFLSSVDAKVELLTKKKELIEQYKKGIMQKIFSQKIRFKDKNGNDYPDWEEKKLGDLCNFTPRKVQKPKEGYWRLGLRSHAKGTFHEYIDDPTKNSMTELFVVKKNDLIVNITFAWEHAIAIANDEDENKLVSHRFPTYSFNDSVIPNFMYFIVTQKLFKKKMNDISPGGAGRNRVMSKKDFPFIKVSIPHIKEQQKIAYFLSSIDSKISTINKELSSLQGFKKGLLQKMFV